ncbi:MAG: helix-turn-helix domain-containing protein [Lentisphaerae bacterium]|nr:helix-turn-helix domain-containing protein [Lentisphaerota bacterium]
MPNVAVILKAEITRLARKEVRSATGPLRAACVALKRRAAAQGREIAALVKEVRRLRSSTSQSGTAPVASAANETQSARVTSAMVKRVRARLGISQAELGRLVGVSQIAVYMWERKGGRLQLRNATRAAFVGIRKLGKREAQRRLAELAKTAKTAKPSRKPKARKAAKARAKT